MTELQKHILDVLIEFDNICKTHNIEYSLHCGTFLGAVRHQGYIPWDDDVDIVVKRDVFNKLNSILKDPKNLKEGYYYQSIETSAKYYNAAPKLRSNSLNVIERVPKTQEAHKGPWVDVFVWDKIPEDEEERRKYYKKLQRIDRILFLTTYIQKNQDKRGLKNSVKGVIQKFNEIFSRFYFFMPALIRKRDKLSQMYNNTDSTIYSTNNYMFYTSYDDFMRETALEEDLKEIVDYDFENVKLPAYKNFDPILKRFYDDYMTIPDKENQITHKIDTF